MMNQVDRGHSVESRWTWWHLSATDLEDYLHLSTAFLMVYSKSITGLTIYLRWKRLFLFVRFNILNWLFRNAIVTARVHSPISRGMRGYALDPENAKALRRKSEEMVGETFA